MRDFSGFFHLPPGDAAGVEYDEFVAAYRALRELGVPLHPLEDAWPAFSAKRATYAAPLDAMARWWRIPPARWIGDRSRVRLHVNVGSPLAGPGVSFFARCAYAWVAINVKRAAGA